MGDSKHGFLHFKTEEFKEGVCQYLRDVPHVHKWILQPFFKSFDVCEDRVFLSGNKTMPTYWPMADDEWSDIF